MPDSDTLPEDLPTLTAAEKKEAIRQAALAKFARRGSQLPGFCTNCGQTVAGQVAMDSADGAVHYCPIHGVRLRPDGSCPRED